MRSGQTQDPPRPLVLFRLGESWFGVDVEKVVGVMAPVEPEPLPVSLPGLEGLVRYRGEALPLFDGGLRLTGVPGRGRLVMVIRAGRAGLVGLTVDEVAGVRRVEPTALHPPSPLLTRLRLDFVEASGRSAAIDFSLLRVDDLFASTEVSVLRPDTPPSGSEPQA